MIDLLTKLPDSEALEKLLNATKFPTIFIFDIKNFKEINLKYGDECGDEVLKKFANLLKDLAKNFKVEAFRIGGDEFVLISQKPFDLDRIEALLCGIQKSLKDQSLRFQDETIKIEYNMGINIDNFNALKKAKIALKVAKAQDKNYMSYSQFAQNLLEENAETLKALILDAIKNEKITPHFQPVFDRAAHIEFYEALSRFDDIKSLQSPNLFFNLAEKYGIYSDLLHVVLKKISNFLNTTDKAISINVNKQDFTDSSTFSMLIEAFKNKNVIFELRIEEFDRDEFMLFSQKLQKNGIKILIDNVRDFQSLNKIDFEFVDFIKVHPRVIREISGDLSQDLIKNLKKLDKKIVATRINSQNSYNTAKENGLEYFQGFLLSEPKKEMI